MTGRVRPASTWTPASAAKASGERSTGNCWSVAGRGSPRRPLPAFALPNDASFGWHRSLGFEDAGCFRSVGLEERRLA